MIQNLTAWQPCPSIDAIRRSFILIKSNAVVRTVLSLIWTYRPLENKPSSTIGDSASAIPSNVIDLGVTGAAA